MFVGTRCARARVHVCVCVCVCDSFMLYIEIKKAYVNEV